MRRKINDTSSTILPRKLFGKSFLVFGIYIPSIDMMADFVN